MNAPLLTNHASTLRAIIDSAGVDALPTIMRRPGVRAVYRVTVHYHDGRARDTVATLVYSAADGARLEIVFRVTFAGKPLVHPITPARYEAWTAALGALNIDRLPDQRNLPTYGADLWLVERAAGSFLKSVIIAPALADGAHAALVHAVRTHLPDALREVQ